ncbi:Plant UBX domain-containing protein 5 (PUX5), partial [Durusdinium trenchii]
MARFGSLDELRKKEEGEENDKNSNSYVGGDKSGLAVEHPDSSKDAWQRMQQLASSSEGGTGPLPSDHRNVTVYRNGFTVGDGPFRPLSDPLNKKFMDEMAAGRCPAELQAGSEQVHVAVHDKRGEDYKEPPAPAYVKFSGEGNTLGGSSSSTAAVEADKASMTV